jgi:hypothetical protein
MQISEDALQLQRQLQYLLKLTRFGVVLWKRTADHNETFTTAMKGLFVATVWEDSLRRYFRLVSSEGETRILATSADSDVVDALYSEAKKKAFNVDKAIADIILRGS